MSDDQLTALVEREQAGALALDDVLGTGDLSRLSNVQRVGHYLRVCRSLGLNPLSRPLDWIVFKDPDGAEKLTLYANQSCAAQLRRQHHIRVEVVRREVVGELFVCEVKASTPDGREDFASKYVPLTNRHGRLTGQQLGNAMMKAETGAKRRVTLSMVGLLRAARRYASLAPRRDRRHGHADRAADAGADLPGRAPHSGTGDR